MQTTGMQLPAPRSSGAEGGGCYIVVIKLSLEGANLIIYNLVITFQSRAAQEINNVGVSVGIKKQMAPPQDF